MKLKDRVAIVTGGSRGIGRAICLALADEGADILLTCDHDMAGAEAVAGEIRALGRRAIAVQADVSQVADVEHMVQQRWTPFAPGGKDPTGEHRKRWPRSPSFSPRTTPATSPVRIPPRMAGRWSRPPRACTIWCTSCQGRPDARYSVPPLRGRYSVPPRESRPARPLCRRHHVS